MATDQTSPAEHIPGAATTTVTTAATAASTGTGASTGTEHIPDTPRAALSATRLPSLTGMRFPAALLVFLFHVSLPAAWLLGDDANDSLVARLAEQAGGLGVTFFFVLSGFVLAWSARDGDPNRSFWRRRYVKIVPNYLIAWALAMALIAAGTAPWRSLSTLFMVQSWIPDYDANFSVNPPGWSLSTEAFFYLCFPLLFAWARRIAPHRLKYWTAAVVAAIVATPFVTTTVIPAGDVYMSNEPSVSGLHLWFAYVFPPTRLLDFLLGILVARAVLLGRWRDIGMVWSGLLLVASYAVAELPGVPYLLAQRVVCVVPCVLLIAAGAIADAEGRFTIFRNRAMTWLGEVSFAFYLLHFVVLAEGRKLVGPDLNSVPAAIAVLVAECAVAVLLAWALYEWVEKPIVRRWSRPRAGTHTSPARSRAT
ncbi:acyltransferase [Streptomyces sp. NBC_01373]|uniref:acyltransferase family protein n=1 Tax=Streptomyces sp. NBC_01373 TaxID=2903843 RepID=UPI00224D2B5E|nr:acyltransferase [Streptomyces sp. NBC_01373]MCX4698838.1 acyltransferase [Streptomyces sp. NBC_01373]